MRRAILIGKDVFDFSPQQNALVELTNVVAESLGDAYPEVWSQLERVQIVLQQEEEIFHETLGKISKYVGYVFHTVNSFIFIAVFDYIPLILYILCKIDCRYIHFKSA